MTLLGHDTIALGDQVAIGNEALPQYRAKQIQTTHTERVAQQFGLPCKVIDEPCFPLGADGNVYGHFLIEALPRLHLLRRHLHRSLPPYRILVRANAPKWLWTILRDVYGVSSDEIITHDSENERVLLRQAIWPSLTLFSDYFHPINNYVFNELRGEAGLGGGPGVRRLFVTRAFFSNPVMQHRPVINEPELAAIASQEYGLFPVAPETMPWMAQINLFAKAELVVGLFGSGLHNALFSGADTRLGVVRFGNLVQSNIGSLRNQSMAYLTAGNDVRPYHLDPDLFRRFLDVLTPQ
jgi:capsular polysaccharide biosynthesis protein